MRHLKNLWARLTQSARAGTPRNFTRCSLIGAAAVVLAAATTAASCTTLLRSGRDGFVVVEALSIPLAAAEALMLLAVAMQALSNPARAVHNPIAAIGPGGRCGHLRVRVRYVVPHHRNSGAGERNR